MNKPTKAFVMLEPPYITYVIQQLKYSDTPNKGQSIFSIMGSNKGISEVPLFAIFEKN